MAKPPEKKDKPKVIFIKKKSKGHGHHGGAWKVAYADFVTAMMAFFMVLWLVSQTDEQTQSSLSHYFRTGVFSGSGHVIGESVPAAHGPTVGGGTLQQREQARLEGSATELDRALDLAVLDDPRLRELREQIDVRVEQDGLLIQISDGGDDLLFGLSSSTLTPTLEEFLGTLGPILGELDNDLQIHGHTDARPFPAGSSYDNWSLSSERADRARRFLQGHGVRDGQVVAVVGHAASDLLVPDAPLDPRNRRLSILAVRRGAEETALHGREASATDPEAAATDAAVASGARTHDMHEELPDAPHDGLPGGAHDGADADPSHEGDAP